MALQVRSFQFTVDSDLIAAQTLTVPLVRTILGCVAANGGPALLILGDWSLPLAVDMLYEFHREQYMPYAPGSKTVVAIVDDYGNGFRGVVTEVVA